MPKTKSHKTDPMVRYIRNQDLLRTEDLHSENLSQVYLYSKISVGTEAAEFLTSSPLGAEMDHKLRARFMTAFEALLSAAPSDVAAVAAAQVECNAVILVYDMLDAAKREAESAKSQLAESTDPNEE